MALEGKSGHNVLRDANGTIYPRKLPVSELLTCLGDRWYALEQLYQSGIYKGQVYTRFYSVDGRHKGILSVGKAIDADAADEGYDADGAKELYKQMVKQKKDEEKEQRRIEREARGISSKETREQHIATFVSKHGNLSGPMVQAFPGWATKWDFQPNCGQVMVTYRDTDGKDWKLLKDLEANFGIRISQGFEEQIKELVEAGKAGMSSDLFSEGPRQAKIHGTFTYTADGSEMREKAAPVGHQKKKRKREVFLLDGSANYAGEDDYRERLSFSVVGLDQLESIDAPESAKLQEEVKALRPLLEKRGFQVGAGLLAVLEIEVDAHRLLPHLCGIYVRRGGDGHGGRPCFQKVRRTGEEALVCFPLHIFWSQTLARWKIGAVDDVRAGFAISAADVARPCDAKPWKLLRPDFPGVAPL